MNTDQLRNFELTYRERNYSAAARRVPVSHQALVKSIRQLEKELGVPLFTADPETGMPMPTVFADELYEFVGVFTSNLVLLNDSFRQLRGNQTCSIRLGCSLGVHNAFGSRLTFDFHELRPDISLELYETNDRLCEQALLNATYDLAMVVEPVTSGCVGETIYRSPMYFWTRRDAPLGRAVERRMREGRADCAAGADTVSADGYAEIADLEGLLVAIPGRGFKCFDQLRETAARTGVKLGGIAEISEIFQIYDFVAQGKGVGFANGTLVEMSCFTYNKDIMAVPMRDLTWGFAIECLKTHALSDHERAFWDWCVRNARAIPHNDIAACR